MNKETKHFFIIRFIRLIGMLLLSIGMANHGLWPYQLPFCLIGSVLIAIT